jgi:hypothetical protein
MKRPYYESILSENTMIRGFSQSVPQPDLVWHRDRERRTIIVVEGHGWQFQRDNCLPELISEGDQITVNAGEYHRLIKGDSDLIVTIIKEKKKLSKKQKKIAQAAPPPDEITGDDFKALRKQSGANEGKASTDREYKAGRDSAGVKGLNKTVAAVNRALKTPGKADDIAAYKKRDEFEKKQRKQKSEGLIRLTENQLNELIEETVEAKKLSMMLEKIEELEEKKKKRKKKKKKKKGGGLSAAVKKSLDKKADKRGLTRGSVYAEFRKGLAAFYTSGSRKGMSAHQWAHARVNSANPSKSWASVKKRKGGKKKKK